MHSTCEEPHTAGDMGDLTYHLRNRAKGGCFGSSRPGQVRLSNVKGYILLMELAGMDCPMMELAG